MKIGVLVLEGPYQHQAADSAYHFTKAALARGHEIVGIFLYTDGVNNGNRFIKVFITEDMVGHKLGEFSPSRIFRGHTTGRAAAEKAAT